MSRFNTCKKLPYGQKINWTPDWSHIDLKDFLHEVQFSAAIGAAHFPAEYRLLKPETMPFSQELETKVRNIITHKQLLITF